MENSNMISKSFREMLNQLEKQGIKFQNETDLFSSFCLAIKLQNRTILEILERDIKDFGYSSHVILPKKHSNKKALIMIINKQKNNR